MRILQHNAEGMTQRVFLDVLYIGAVIDDRSALHIIETVDQVGDRRFSGACRTDKGDFLARLCIQTDIF